MLLKNLQIIFVFVLSLSFIGCGDGNLAGFDDNHNDVRDDVDEFIGSLYYLTNEQRNSLTQMAQVYQHIFTADFYRDDKREPNPIVINSLRDEFEFASNCMLKSFGINRELFKTEFKTLRRKVANNDARADKVKEFDRLTTVVFYQPTHFDDNDDTCMIK